MVIPVLLLWEVDKMGKKFDANTASKEVNVKLLNKQMRRWA